MDIDDILASIDRESLPQSTHHSSKDHHLLTRYWVAERAVPELLPWPGELMERLMGRVNRQIESIEDITASSADPDPDPDPAFGYGYGYGDKDQTVTLKLSILQTDLARSQYLLRSLLRQRLDKLARYSMHYLVLSSTTSAQSQSQTQSQNPNQKPEHSIPIPTPSSPTTTTTASGLLSSKELSFLHTHQTHLARHYGTSFLGSFPPQLRRLDDNAGGTSMIQGPDAKEVVFVRCLVEGITVVVPTDSGSGNPGFEEEGDGEEDGEEGVRMRMGDVWVVRWEGVKRAWSRGEVEVL